jgi:hypothetical protein
VIWSGRRGSNPQPTAWEAATLPLSYSRFVRNYIPQGLYRVPLKAAISGQRLLRMHCFTCEERVDLVSDLVSYAPDFLKRQSFRIAKWPIIPPQAGDIRALIATAHRNEQVCILRQFFGQLLRPGVAEVDTDLPHDGQNFGMDPRTRLGSGRDGLCFLTLGKLVEESSRHL